MKLNRRDLFRTMAAAAPLVLAVGEVRAATEEKAAAPAPAAPPAAHVPVPLPFDPKTVSDSIRNNRDTHVEMTLTLGEARVRYWTSDLTAEYVRLNADYTT